MCPKKDDNKYILAIDHGTSGMKTAIVSVAGSVVDFAFQSTSIYFSAGGGAEQDPDEWWRALVASAQQLMERQRHLADDIVAISVTSTFSTTVAVDKSGLPLMNAITWMDSRGAPYVKQIMGGWPRIEGYNIFKILAWIPKTGGGPTLSGKDDVAHILFIKNRHPDIYENTYMFLPSKDYLNMKLTGRFLASFDSVQLFWMTDTRDVCDIRYEDGLIRKLGIEKDKLPPLAHSTDIIGSVLPSIAEQLGLRPDVKVVTGSPDHQTACIGSGAVRDFDGHIYVGTSGWVQCVIPFKKTDVFHSIASFPTAIPGKYQSVNEQDLAGGCLSFLIDNIIYHQNSLFGTRPEDPYSFIDSIVQSVPAGSRGLIFLPWLNGERTPVDDTTLRGGFYNISKTTTQDDFIRAVLEGVAYNTRWSLKYVERFIGRRLEALNIVGGGAISDAWCQIFADVLNRDIRQVRQPRQANARGAAFIASVGLGYLAFDDIPARIAVKCTYHPDKRHKDLYDKCYKAFISIYRKNRRVFRYLNG